MPLIPLSYAELGELAAPSLTANWAGSGVVYPLADGRMGWIGSYLPPRG